MDDTRLLEEALTNAKEFQNFDNVVMAVSLHPEWLTLIPENREWSILHQVAYSGNLDNLYRVLALQKANPNFKPLTPSRDGKTMVDAAGERTDAPEIKAHIQKLVILDTMLSYAKECKWDQCYELVKQNPIFANQKPPYRQFYLIHHMASAGALDQLKRFQEIPNCKFQVTLRATGKTAPTIARESGHIQFAEYLEKNYKALFEDTDDANFTSSYPASAQAKSNTQRVNLAMDQPNVMSNLDAHIKSSPAVHHTRVAVDNAVKKLNAGKEAGATSKPVAGPVSPTQEAKSKEALRNVLTCPLTFEIYTDPGMYIVEHRRFRSLILC